MKLNNFAQFTGRFRYGAILAIMASALPMLRAQTLTTSIAVGTDPYVAVVNPVTNKIYVSNGYNGTVSVIDGANPNNSPVVIQVGITPGEIAVNPVTNKIYVINSGSDTVSVIDGASNTVAATVATEVSPYSIAVNTVTNQAYVSNYGSNRLIAIDAKNNYAVSVINVGVGPQAVAVNPVTNKIYVANQGAAPSHLPSVTVVDGTSNTVDKTLFPGAGQKSAGPLAVNPASNQIYFLNGAYLSVFDGTSYATKSIAMGSNPAALAVNPVTNQIYVANQSSNNVTFVDGASFTAVASVATGAGPFSITVNPATNQVYTANLTGTATMIAGAYNAPINFQTGARPTAVTVNPVTDKIYVLNQGYDPSSGDSPDYGTVSVIDGATNNTTTITMGTGPQSVVVNPVTNKIYVGNVTSGSVTVFDANSYSSKVVAVGVNPWALALNPLTNKIYVTNSPGASTAGSVSVIDGTTDSITATVTTGLNPNSLAVDPVTNKIYVANYSSNSVTVIDGATNSTSNLAVGNNPGTIAVNPATNKVYVTNLNSNTVSVINGSQVFSIAAGQGPYGVAVNPVTNMIYVINAGSNNVTVIDGLYDVVMGTPVAVGAYPVSIDVNPVTNKIYVSNDDSNTITVIDGPTFTTTTVNVGSYPVYVKVNPTTNKIYVADWYPTGETVIDGATNIATAIDGGGLYADQIAVNPVTNQIYVTNYGSNSVTVIQEQLLDPVPLTTSITPLTNNETRSSSPSFTFASHSGTTATPLAVFFQTDSWQNAWTQTTGSNPDFSGTLAALQPGFHMLYAYSTDGREGTFSQSLTSVNAPLTGAIQAYGFVVLPPLTAQTITFNAIPSHSEGGSIGLTAQASSGLPVSFASSTPAVCTVTGTAAFFVSAGTCSITASQSGNGTYAPAPMVTQSFTIVSKGSPTVVSFSPSAGKGTAQAFSAVYSDPNSIADLKTVRILFNTSVNGVHACYVLYYPATNALYLTNDADTATTGPLTPGSSGSLSNSQCKLAGAGTSVSKSGNNLTVNYALTFTSSFTGLKNVYPAAFSSVVNSGWIEKGTWTP